MEASQGPSLIDLTAEELLAVPWIRTIPAGTLQAAEKYLQAKYSGAIAGDASGEAGIARVLLAACTLHMVPGREHQPFEPFLILRERRTASLGDFSDGAVAAFEAALGEIAHAAVRARLADIVWVRKRSYRAAEIAIDAYLETANVISEEESWLPMRDSLERAFQIALLLGRKHGASVRVQGEIVRHLTAREAEEDGYGSLQLMRLLLKYGVVNETGYAAMARRLALVAEAKRDWHCAHDYWETAAELARATKDREGVRRATLAMAAVLEKQADDAIRRVGVGHLTAAHYLQQAVEVARRTSGASDEVERLHRKLLEVQEGISDEMHPLSTPIDITEYVAQTEAALTGRSLRDALIIWATMKLIPSVVDMRALVEEQLKRYALSGLFPKVAVDAKGRSIGRQSSSDSADPEERNQAILVEMVTHGILHCRVASAAHILPAREVIVREHPLELDHILSIVRYHPAVVEARAPLIAEGIFAGFTGDMPKAIHLLIPQLEDVVRTMLVQRGVRVSTLSSEGIQEDRNLNWLLHAPELNAVLGEDVVFTLRALLVDRFGPNIRNRMAHGLMEHHEFFSHEAVFAWWMVMRILMIPFLRSVLAQETDRVDEPGAPS